MMAQANLRMAGTVNDSIVDGPGLRFTIFVQGCYHNCKGCHNPESHSINGGYEVTVFELLEKISANKLLSGVSFSGGEPFLQPKPLTNLAIECKKLGLNIITYTGYTWEELLLLDGDVKELLRETDILIDGRYVEELRSLDTLFRGSKNQRVINVKESFLQRKIVETYFL